MNDEALLVWNKRNAVVYSDFSDVFDDWRQEDVSRMHATKDARRADANPLRSWLNGRCAKGLPDQTEPRSGARDND